MSIVSMVAVFSGLAVIIPLGHAPDASSQPRMAEFSDSECLFVNHPIDEAATLCLQFDDADQEAPRWRLQNNTDWVLDLDSRGAWPAEIPIEVSPTLDDLTSYFTRLCIDDQGSDALAVQPDESVYMPAYLSADMTGYLIPEGELRFNEKATAGMIAVASAVGAADKVATDRSKLYRIVKRMKACASAAGGALLATEQTDEAYAAVLADLAAYSACEKYLKGVAKQQKVKLPPSFRVVAVEFGDNFFIQARNAVIKLFQFAR